jgi:hypothetical protein
VQVDDAIRQAVKYVCAEDNPVAVAHHETGPEPSDLLVRQGI